MEQLSKLRQTTRAVMCAECGKCTTMCPLSKSGNFSPRKVAMESLEAEAEGRGVGVFRCLTCGTCELRCPQDVHFSEYVRGMRSLLPPERREPCPHGEALDCVARLMADRGAKRDLSWITDDLKVAQEGEIALFVGCLSFFDLMFADEFGIKTIEIARSAIRLLNAMDVVPVVLAEERCCGHDQLWSGDPKTFVALAEANAKTYADRGVKHIVTTCAECCRTWRLDYAEAVPDYAPKVEHLSEFLIPRLESGELKFPGNGELRLTYQDPCRLVRHLEVFEPGRQILGARPNVELFEMDRHPRDAQCCGTSGFVHCDRQSHELQTARLARAAETGASKMITSCPKCWIHFACTQAEQKRTNGGGPSIEVEDLAVLAARMLQGSEKKEKAATAAT
ncbi:MAG: (Fe-S)-binding protein [Phycisphaerae bacterium]|jgi:Fe-S oxidoreductase